MKLVKEKVPIDSCVKTEYHKCTCTHTHTHRLNNQNVSLFLTFFCQMIVDQLHQLITMIDNTCLGNDVLRYKTQDNASLCDTTLL